MSENELEHGEATETGEGENVPAPSDPEHPDAAPEDPAADEPGQSDDDATGADTAGDDDDSDDSGEAGQGAPAAPDTGARLDEVTTGLAKAARTYSNRVASVLGDDWLGLTVCPLCADDFPGLLTPTERSDEVIATVRPLLGFPDLTTYSEDRFARQCERCSGMGKTLTGSKVPAYLTMTCPACKGAGFQSAEDGYKVGPTANGSDGPPPPTHVEDQPLPAMSEASLDALEKMVAEGRAALAGLG